MKSLAEVAPFLAFALVAHIGAFAMVARGGISSGGDGGEGQFTLQGADPGMTALIAAWERAPDAPQPRVVASDLAVTPEALPEAPYFPAQPVLQSLQTLVLPDSAAEHPIDTAPPETPIARPAITTPVHDLPQMTDDLPTAALSMQGSTFANLTESPLQADERSDILPDSTLPPPLALAAAPERSPTPPARPRPRDETQATRAAPAPSAPAQSAAGAGTQGREGQGSAAETSRAQADTGGLVAQWGGSIRSSVQRQQRHPAGIRAGGTVHLRLDVHSDGRLLTVALRESSGHAALDQAAIDAVRRARLPAAPRGLSGSYQFNLPVQFRS